LSELFNGIILGLSLAILVGPILFSIIHTSMEKGMRAGLLVGAGIWFSDLLFITATLAGLGYLSSIVQWPHFDKSMSIGGGLVLLFIGMSVFFRRPERQPVIKPGKKIIGNLAHFMQGFFINTINPFTVFFWLGVVSIRIKEDKVAASSTILFLSGIFFTIVLTDFLKVLLAKKLGRWLTPGHIFWVRKISGAALMIFGLALFIRLLF